MYGMYGMVCMVWYCMYGIVCMVWYVWYGMYGVVCIVWYVFFFIIYVLHNSTFTNKKTRSLSSSGSLIKEKLNNKSKKYIKVVKCQKSIETETFTLIKT